MTTSSSNSPISKEAQLRLDRMKRSSRRTKKKPFNLELWMKSRWEILRMSMFFLPMLAIFAAIILGIVLSYVDFYLNKQGVEPPSYLTTNVDSARVILSTIAGATISFAGTAFSVSLLVIQLGSSQYSPRIVHTLFKDPFNRRIVALVMGTFTYCLVVMRSVESPSNDDGVAVVVPNISVACAFVFGIVSLLAIVAFIDHSAGTMDISNLLESVTRDTVVHIKATWREETLEEVVEEEDRENQDDDENQKDEEQDGSTSGQQDGDNQMEEKSSGNKENKVACNSESNGRAKGEDVKMNNIDDCYVVRFRSSGWIQEIDMKSLLQLVPPNGYLTLHTLAGRYACPGTAVCSVYPKPQDVDRGDRQRSRRRDISVDKVSFESRDPNDQDDEASLLEDFDLNVLDAIMIGYSRTIRSDAAYGLRQLVDVVLKALSPGVNDPTTAQDGIFHIAAVVIEFLRRVPPERVLKTDEGGKLFCTEQQDYNRIVRLAFEEVRVCAAASPAVALYLLEALRLIRESLEAFGRPKRAPEIERQARKVEEGICNASHINDDYDFISKARRDRFDAETPKEYMGF